MIRQLCLRLTLWFLLTANFSPANIFIGLAVAFLLPGLRSRRSALPERFKDLFQGLGKILRAIPQAYWEGIEMIRSPHTEEAIVREPMALGRTPGAIFLDIFLITFTPKTIVLNYREEGDYEVHYLRRRKG
jgi:multicomponent Na+:H+ antiporter subunit E